MAKDSTVVYVRMVITNQKAIDAMADALRLAEEIADGDTWNNQPAKLLKRLRYAAKRVVVQMKRAKE